MLEPQNGLKVRRVNGGSSACDVDILKYLDPSAIVLVTMDHAHDSTFDNFLLVPMTGGKFVCLCTDANYTESNGHLNYNADAWTKLQNSLIANRKKHVESGFSLLPCDCDPIVVIVSSKRLSDKFAVDDDHGVPLVVCGRQQLGSVPSHALVPPKFRE